MISNIVLIFNSHYQIYYDFIINRCLGVNRFVKPENYQYPYHVFLFNIILNISYTRGSYSSIQVT